MLHDTFKESLKEALRAKDQVKLLVIRGLLTAFTNELVATSRKPDATLPDDEILGLIRRAIKQRKDSIEQFSKGGRDDLVAQEKAELAILEAYVPALMPREEIGPLARAKAAEMGVADKSGAGKLTGALMKDLKGRADGADVKAVVDSLF